jgi:hypothetical protein
MGIAPELPGDSEGVGRVSFSFGNHWTRGLTYLYVRISSHDLPGEDWSGNGEEGGGRGALVEQEPEEGCREAPRGAPSPRPSPHRVLLKHPRHHDSTYPPEPTALATTTWGRTRRAYVGGGEGGDGTRGAVQDGARRGMGEPSVAGGMGLERATSEDNSWGSTFQTGRRTDELTPA